MTSVKMNVLGIALIVCGVALICSALIPKFRSEPASTDDAIEPFVPQPWVDPHADEELNKKDQSQGSPQRAARSAVVAQAYSAQRPQCPANGSATGGDTTSSGATNLEACSASAGRITRSQIAG